MRVPCRVLSFVEKRKPNFTSTKSRSSSNGHGRSGKPYNRDSSNNDSVKVGKYYPGGKGPPGGRGNNLFANKDYAIVKKGNFTCPWHGKHKWNTCYGNPDCDSYCDGFRLSKRERQGDAHLLEEEDEEVPTPKKKKKKKVTFKKKKKKNNSDDDAHFAETIPFRVAGGESSSSDSDEY